jgi:hypothetical protein
VHGLPGTPKTAWRIARGSGKTSPLRYFREMNTLVFYLREETDKEAVIEF